MSSSVSFASSFRPKFFLNGLPKNNKSSLSHCVETLATAEIPNHSEGIFRRCENAEKSAEAKQFGRRMYVDRDDSRMPDDFFKEEDVKRYDRRVFVKVDESRSPDEWVQYAICHGFADHKFVKEILKGFESNDKLVLDSTDVLSVEKNATALDKNATATENLPLIEKPSNVLVCVEPSAVVEVSNHSGGNFRRAENIEKDAETKRFDRRVFVKVDESRTPEEWVQYAVSHGFADHKFMPEILKGFEGNDKVVVDSTDVLSVEKNAAALDKNATGTEDLPNNEKPSNFLHCGESPAIVEVSNHSGGNVRRAENVESDLLHCVEPPAIVEMPNHSEENFRRAENDKDTLFFEFVKAEFRHLESANQRAFKKTVMEILFS